MQFTAILENFETELWSYHIKVPSAIAAAFFEKPSKQRVVCTLGGKLEFQCALMPAGDGVWFININKKIRDSLGLKTGMSVAVSLAEDESEFGLPMPEELAEVLATDPEGHRHFEALTPGKKRNLLYIVGQPKTSDTRITRAIAVIEHLKKNGGKINFKQLAVDLKESSLR